LTLASLLQTWRARDPQAWAADPENFRDLGARILKLGEPLVAYDIVAEGAKLFPENVQLRQLLGLALARSGASETANAVLHALYKEGHRDEETLGLLARTYKDLGNFQRAFEFYSTAYQSSRGYYSGINAATSALMLGKRPEAEVIAREVLAQCRRRIDETSSGAPDRYWLLSTLGEASLLLQEWDEAEDWYAQAIQAAGRDWGSLQSTARNARLLLLKMGISPQRIDQLFKMPSVVVFSGHMIDIPGRASPRFPPEIEKPIKDEIRLRLKELNAGFGYASAARGADIIFHEVLIEMNAESHVLIPHDKQVFVKESVGADPLWVARFEKVLAQAVEVHQSSGQTLRADATAYEFANRMLLGLGAVRAEHLETKLAALAVWDGRPGDGAGGTASAVEHWRRAGIDIEIIDTNAFHEARPDTSGLSGNASPVSSASSVPSGFLPEIRALLFADVEGFSKLLDEELPPFVSHFLGLVGGLLKEPGGPLLRNTWGDGLYFVFSTVREAGQFALSLIDRVRSVDWPKKGLPRLNLRIGLHAGPVYQCEDPVTGRTNYFGSHVSRAARIEPITPAGYVYASQHFAALAAAEGVREFRCNYVGQTPMPKGYGTFPTYVVLRR
jgi:class 3 adenylate cyclase/tetratricopeptide (TPR) repeat protein